MGSSSRGNKSILECINDDEHEKVTEYFLGEKTSIALSRHQLKIADGDEMWKDSGTNILCCVLCFTSP